MKTQKLHQFLLAAALAAPWAAQARGDMPPMPGAPGMPGGPGMMRGHPPAPFLFGIELTEAQEDKLFQLMHAQQPYLHEQRKAHDKAVRALHDMGASDKFDEAAAARLAQAAAQAQANMLLQHARTHQKVLALLTPEQRKQLADRKLRPHRMPFPGGPNER